VCVADAALAQAPVRSFADATASDSGAEGGVIDAISGKYSVIPFRDRVPMAAVGLGPCLQSDARVMNIVGIKPLMAALAA
jgi:hypothetical protein